MSTNRVPKGIRTGGQFAASTHSEPGVSVGNGAGMPDVGEASVEQVRTLATHTDPAVRAETTASPRVPDDVLEQLADREQPATVRLAAVNTGYAGTADRAAQDPHPLVRAAALANWDISDHNRQRLGKDERVQHLIGMLRN